MMTINNIKNWRAPCLILLLLLIAFYDVVFLNKTFKVSTANSQALPTGAYGQTLNKPKFIPVNGTDSPVMEEPMLEFIKQNLRRGIIPLWNPHQACGFSLIGMIEIGIFFPLNLIMYLLPSFYAWDTLILCRLFLGGLLTFFFMRSVGFKETAAVVAGLTFMLSGPMLLLQYWTANVDILLPLLLLGIHHMIKKPAARSVGILAMIVGMTILAGHPEHILLVHLYGLFFFIFLLFIARPAQLSTTIKHFIAAYFLGAALSSIVLLPFLREFSTEFWHGHPAGTGLLMEEQRDRALSLALPHFFQKENLTFQWSFAGWWGGYLGTIPLALAFLSLWSRHKKFLNYFFAAMLIGIIGKEYGLPFINWIGRLPLLDLPRYAIHTPVLAAFSTAVLAGMGARTLLAGKNIFLKGLIFSLTLITITVLQLFKSQGTDYFQQAIEASAFALGVLVIFQALLLTRDKNFFNRRTLALLVTLLVFSELFLYIHRERPRRFDSFPDVPYISWLKNQPERSRAYGNFWAFYPNTATGFSVDDLGYFFGLVPKRFVPFVNTLLIKDHFKNDLRPPALRAFPIQNRDNFLDLLNVRYIVTPATDEYSRNFTHFQDISLRFPLVYNGEVKIYERPGAFQRVFITHKILFEPDEKKILTLLEQLQGRLKHLAIVQTPKIPAVIEALNHTPLEDKSRAVIRSYLPNEVIVDTVMENPGLLVLSDSYHPDWRVTVNGQDWKILPTNYLLRGVFLPSGQHEVIFTFSPPSVRIGLWLSMLALLITIGIMISPSWFRNRSGNVKSVQE